ncbi:hypothetical protein RAS1_06910 [Phycisphaerae bacterium RAS1]|nr:hypothetical protein RAS1_06910 [Phycisphaerae bacterium RAS1]
MTGHSLPIRGSGLPAGQERALTGPAILTTPSPAPTATARRNASDPTASSAKSAAAEWARSFEKALEIRRKLAAARPENRELQLELAASCVKLADRRAPSRESIQADALYRESESITRRLVATLPGDRESRSQLAVALVKRGDFLRTGGDAEGGLRLFEESLALREEVLREHPGDIRAARDASVAHLKIGRAVLDAGQARSIEIARQHIARALELRRGLLQREPETARAQRDVLEAQKALADLLVSEKQWSQVQPLLAQAVEQARQLRLADSADARGLYDLADICGMAGDAALKADDKNQARTYYDEAMKAAREYLATDPAAAKPRYAAATAAGRMARLCDALSRRDDAARWWLEALEHIDAATKAAPANELLRVEKQRIQAEVDRLEGGSGA